MKLGDQVIVRGVVDALDFAGKDPEDSEPTFVHVSLEGVMGPIKALSFQAGRVEVEGQVESAKEESSETESVSDPVAE